MDTYLPTFKRWRLNDGPWRDDIIEYMHIGLFVGEVYTVLGFTETEGQQYVVIVNRYKLIVEVPFKEAHFQPL